MAASVRRMGYGVGLIVRCISATRMSWLVGSAWRWWGLRGVCGARARRASDVGTCARGTAGPRAIDVDAILCGVAVAGGGRGREPP